MTTEPALRARRKDLVRHQMVDEDTLSFDKVLLGSDADPSAVLRMLR